MAKKKQVSLTLARRVFNTPQLILSDDLDTIAQFLVNRANGVDMINGGDFVNDVVETDTTEQAKDLTQDEKLVYDRKRLGISADGTTGHLDVVGTLVAKHDDMNACMGFTSYEKLLTTFRQQVDMGIEKLVLNLDSGGGEAFSCFEMAQEVKDLAVANDIPIYAYIDGLSASACFAWASIADEVVARKGSEIGSVGVVVQLINNSKMLQDKGITRKFITHGSNKVPFDDDGEFSKAFVNKLQEKVNKTGLQFNQFIAKNRNMQVEDVIATQAEVFDSEEALKIGFIDKVMTKSEFYNDYLPNASNRKSMYFLQSEENMTKNVEMNTDELQELKSQLATATDKNEQLTATIADMQADYDTVREQLEVNKVALAEALQAKADLEAEKVQAELTARVEKRTAKLEASLGKDNEQVAVLLASTETLSDEQFEVIAQSLGAKQETQQKQFAEIGGEGQDSVKQLSLEEQLAQTAEKMTKKA